MSSNLGRVFAHAGLLFLASSGPVVADIFDDLQVHGFATQGFIKTSDNSFFGDSEDGSFDFRELGINASIQPSPNLRLAGQLLSRKAGKLSDGDIAVDFALADFTLHSSASGSAGIMAGRIKNPLGLFNETRDVASTRPGVFVPQVVYYDKVRDLFLSADGIGARADVFGQIANINLYLGIGQPQIDENVEHGFLGTGFSGDLDANGMAYLGRVLIESADNAFRASLSLSRISMDFERDLTDPIGDGRIDSTFGIASAQISGERWVFTTEYMREPTKWRGFQGSVFSGLDAAAEGYFVQLSWVFSEEVSSLVRYGEGFANRNDRSGKDFSRKTFGMAPAHSRYSKIWTAGVRWDVTRNLMLRAEYQKHNGTFVLSSRENPDPADTDPDWDLFALEASYHF